MEIRETPQGLRLHWRMKEQLQQWREAREGAYMLRSNLQGEDAAELWQKYMQLTEAEASFRALKSALSIRPIHHQLEKRVKAHVLVAFLGYALWVTLKHLLIRKQASLSPGKALALLSTLHSADIVLPTTDGRQIRLRRVTEPTREQKESLAKLGLELPKQLDPAIECSVDFATA
jgi:hypothetical protein